MPAAGCEEVGAGGGDLDADLAGARPGVLDLFVGEVVGRAEGVRADGAHGCLSGVW
ncbi:hypothetical protein GCM10020256_42210 [Streptomyces thermocoprophilus]